MLLLEGTDFVSIPRINHVWDFVNPLNEWHTFAVVGTGKNQIVVTLHAGKMTVDDQNLVGELYREAGKA